MVGWDSGERQNVQKSLKVRSKRGKIPGTKPSKGNRKTKATTGKGIKIKIK